MSDARYIIGELLDAIHSLTYQENGRWYCGVHGDSDITAELGWSVYLAEEFLQKGGEQDEA